MKKTIALMVMTTAALTAVAVDYNVKDFDGSVVKAAEAAAKAGGGRIVVPAGVWKSGTIWLKSHSELHLEKGAVILGSTEEKDYNRDDVFPENFHSVAEEWSGGHLVMAHEAEDIAITGEGTIDGNGPAFFGECDFDSWFPGYKYGLKLHPTNRTWFRPGPMIGIFLSKNIRIQGVTLKNTPCWTCHIRCSDGVDIEGVTIDADRTIANSDGFSIDCTKNVKIRKCLIKTGDDGFAIRASCPNHHATNFCENILIEDCEVWSAAFGIRWGIGEGTIRNATVRRLDCREAHSSIGFTPAWVPVARNCFIENIRHYDCQFREAARGVDISQPRESETRVKDILFENCVFETLEPGVCWCGKNTPENFVFRNCERKFLKRVKVRQGMHWEIQHRDRRDRRFFDMCDRCRGAFTFENCKPVDYQNLKGALLLSFDDRNFDGWTKAIPLFEKYDAHATFFVSGTIDSRALTAMKALEAKGHSIGLHGEHHANADEYIAAHGAAAYWEHELRTSIQQCRVSYVDAWYSFAYPNCRWSEESEKLFREKGFKHTRAAVKGAFAYDPHGQKKGAFKPLYENDAVFFPVGELKEHSRLDTIIMGEAYNTDIGEILKCIERLAAKREVMNITSHDIAPNAKSIHMKTEWLEAILKKCQELGVAVLGYDELP